MLQRDVIMRQIQQAVQVLMQVFAQVLKLKSEERYEEAVETIREAFRGTELVPRPVAELSPDELLELCRTEQGFAVDLALAMADLLREEAEIISERGDPETARASAAKAHALYRESLATEGAALPMDIAQKLSGLEEMLDRNDDARA